jgi:hypothetical protein
MKALWPGLLHKSEQHTLHLDLQNASQVRVAHLAPLLPAAVRLRR